MTQKKEGVCKSIMQRYRYKQYLISEHYQHTGIAANIACAKCRIKKATGKCQSIKWGGYALWPAEKKNNSNATYKSTLH